MKPAPELSAVLPTGHLLQAHWTIRALAMRADEVRLELIVLYEHGEPPTAGDPMLARFAGTRFIRTDTTRSAAAARALGVEAAGAPVAVFAEPHCFPRAGWARALVDAHAEGEWTVVGPQFECGNPSDASVAILLSDYTDWVAPAERREMKHLPGHNSAYRRDSLLAVAELPALLEAESVLHQRLRELGGRLLHEPAATVGHRNFTRPRCVWPERRAVGQAFAATRARGWSLPRRLAAAVGSVLLPPLLIARRLAQARRRGHGPALVRGLPAVITASCAQAVGEALGYLVGLGDAPRRLGLYEFSPRLGTPPSKPPDPATLTGAVPLGALPARARA